MNQSKLAPLVDPIVYLGTSYSRALTANPLLTKCITSGLLSALGNYLAQKFGDNAENINLRSIAAFGIFGFGATGPLSHFFLNWLERYGPSSPVYKLIVDRFLYGPLFLLLALYALTRLEGSSHELAWKQTQKVYWSALQMMWKVWIVVQYVNLNFVPLQYRVLVTNLVSVGWNIILSRKRMLTKKREE